MPRSFPGLIATSSPAGISTTNPIMDTKKKHICLITNLLRKSFTARIFTFSGYFKSKGHYYTMQCQINPFSQFFFFFRVIVPIDDLAAENEASKLESLRQVIQFRVKSPTLSTYNLMRLIHCYTFPVLDAKSGKIRKQMIHCAFSLDPTLRILSL